jgi:hypothetical protein
VCFDADRWKAWEHDRWLTPIDQPGALFIWGEPTPGGSGRKGSDERAHIAYSHHIVAELEVEEVVNGVLKRYWKAKSDNNHWLDASVMADVAAAMLGIHRGGQKPPPAAGPGKSWFAK